MTNLFANHAHMPKFITKINAPDDTVTINNTTVITWSRDVTAPRGAVIESFAVE